MVHQANILSLPGTELTLWVSDASCSHEVSWPVVVVCGVVEFNHSRML